MTTIYDVINEKLLIKAIEKRPGAFKEIFIYDNEGNTILPFPQVLDDYNQGIDDCDVHSHLTNVFTTARAYWRI